MNDLIENSAQITPEWLTKTLLRNGHLKQGSAAEISTQTFQSFFADFYRIEIKYSDDAAPELPELMILKVSFAINEQVLEMGRAECDAYRKLFAVMPAAPFPRVGDLGKEMEKVLAAGIRHGRRCHRRAESSWQAMVSVENFHRSARARPPPADTPDESPAVTTSQVSPQFTTLPCPCPRRG